MVAGRRPVHRTCLRCYWSLQMGVVVGVMRLQALRRHHHHQLLGVVVLVVEATSTHAW